jgi:hypothetical protein
MVVASALCAGVALHKVRGAYFGDDFTTDDTDDTDFFEQKETKQTKSRFRLGVLRCLRLLLSSSFPDDGAEGGFSIREIREIRGSLSLLGHRRPRVLCGSFSTPELGSKSPLCHSPASKSRTSSGALSS